MLRRLGMVVFALLAVGSMTGCVHEAVGRRAQADLHCTEEVRVIEMADGYHAYCDGDHAVYQVEPRRQHHGLLRVDPHD